MQVASNLANSNPEMAEIALRNIGRRARRKGPARKSTESKSCWSSATSASAISVFTRLSDKFVKLVLQTTLPVPALWRCWSRAPGPADHAARRHSAARGRKGAVQALAVQRARRPLQ